MDIAGNEIAGDDGVAGEPAVEGRTAPDVSRPERARGRAGALGPRGKGLFGRLLEGLRAPPAPRQEATSIAIASGTPIEDQTEYRPPTQPQNPKTRSSLMPNAWVAARLVETAARCRP